MMDDYLQMFVKAFNIALNDDDNNDISAAVAARFSELNIRFMAHTNHGSPDARDTLEKYNVLMPSTNSIEVDNNLLPHAFDRVEYMNTGIYDQLPIETWRHYDALPIAQQEVMSNVYGAYSNAKQCGYHNMMKVASNNLCMLEAQNDVEM